MPKRSFRDRRGRKRPYTARAQQASANRELMEMEKQQMLRPTPFTYDTKISVPRRICGKLHTFYASAIRGNILSSTTVPSAGAINFILADLNNVSDYTNLFDQYRILAVKLEFIMLGSTNPLTGPPGYIQTAIDYDDVTTPGSANELMQYDTVQVAPIGQYFERTLRPRSAPAMYSGAFTSFGNVYAQWLDSASPSVQHYGIKYYIPIIPTSVYTIQPIAHYQIQCRSIH
jgi:hypothetical protein